jgi:hypothetical protein
MRPGVLSQQGGVILSCLPPAVMLGGQGSPAHGWMTHWCDTQPAAQVPDLVLMQPEEPASSHQHVHADGCCGVAHAGGTPCSYR